MQEQEAIQLISRAIRQHSPQRWADLGCGSGTFTNALAHLLPAGSTIHAVDREEQTLPRLMDGVEIIFSRADFEQDNLSFRDVDGMMIANALHYCKDAAAVLRRLMEYQRPAGRQFLVVEYDSTASNRWVPYPLPFDKLKKIFTSMGFQQIQKLGEHPSVFRRENMYTLHACF